jgi:gas vesicle protein
MGDRAGGFLSGFILGAVAGAVAALLLAPSSGDELRRKIEQKGEGFVDDAERFYDDARAEFDTLQDRGRIVLQDNVKKAQKAVQDAQDKLGATATDVVEG